MNRSLNEKVNLNCQDQKANSSYMHWASPENKLIIPLILNTYLFEIILKLLRNVLRIYEQITIGSHLLITNQAFH